MPLDGLMGLFQAYQSHCGEVSIWPFLMIVSLSLSFFGLFAFAGYCGVSLGCSHRPLRMSWLCCVCSIQTSLAGFD